MADELQRSTEDLTEAFNAIRAKRKDLDLLFSYVNGGQPLKYSTYRLQEVFNTINVHFEINWCSLIVDTTLDRLELVGFSTKDSLVNEKFSDIFKKIHVDIEADKAHFAALATSQGYIIAWKEGEDTAIYYNDPRICAVFYEADRPRVKRYAAKWFDMNDGRQEVTLYYPDKIEHWISQKTASPIDKASGFTFSTEEINPYGVIPVFELHSPGEIFKILTLQDAINKLFSDMMASAEYGVAPMRWLISNADIGNIKNSPNLWVQIPAGDGQGQQTSVGQFDATGLVNFWQGIDPITNSIAVITRTPRHYFMSSGSNISGEALLAMEAPLVKKVKKRQMEFAAQWQDIAQFLLLLDGVNIPASDISVMWAKPESIQPYTEAQARQLSFNTGIPLITLLRREGWTEDEITAMQSDMELQKKASQTLAQAVLNNLRIKNQQSNDVVDNEALV